jgi:integrase
VASEGIADTWSTRQKSAVQIHQANFQCREKDGLITSNPVDRIDAKLFKIDRAEPKIITPEQLERLLKVACDETKPLFALSGLAGIWWSEIEGLRWSDIHADTIVISAKSPRPENPAWWTSFRH